MDLARNRGGRRVDLGLGGYPYTTLREARQRAFECRKASRSGRDPRVLNRRCPTFAEAVETVIAMHRPSWRPGGESEANWRRTLGTYAVPRLGQMQVDQITSAGFMAVLQPIWNEKAVTARRGRQRIGAVMRWAIAQGHRADNPAGDPIRAALPRNGRQSRHFKALPHHEVATALTTVRQFVLRRRGAALAGVPGVDGCPVGRGPRRVLGRDRRRDRCLEGAGRSHEDLPVASRSAVAPGTRSARGGAGGWRRRPDLPGGAEPPPPLATGVWRALLRRLRIDATVHGFRRSFRDWCGETGVPPLRLCSWGGRPCGARSRLAQAPQWLYWPGAAASSLGASV